MQESSSENQSADGSEERFTKISERAYMSNTGNLTPMDKSTFRWFRWIHRTNVYSVGEVFFRWKINDVMTHGKQISVKLRLFDGSDGSIGQASLL